MKKRYQILFLSLLSCNFIFSAHNFINDVTPKNPFTGSDIGVSNPQPPTIKAGNLVFITFTTKPTVRNGITANHLAIEIEKTEKKKQKKIYLLLEGLTKVRLADSIITNWYRSDYRYFSKVRDSKFVEAVMLFIAEKESSSNGKSFTCYSDI